MKTQPERMLARIVCYSPLFVIALLPYLAFGTSVGIFTVFDIPVAHSSSGIGNVWEDVSVTCTLTSPTWENGCR